MPHARSDEIKWTPGEYYHIYNRGARQISIFREDGNYEFVLRKMHLYANSLKLSVIAYCLMPNHYHFLLRQDGEKAAGLLPQFVFNSYTKAYNKRYDHHGTLFERRYKAKRVAKADYLLHLCRYIHANPVKDGLVAEPQDWPYSNYQEWINLRGGTLVDRNFIHGNFATTIAYQEFVHGYLQSRQLPNDVAQHLLSIENK
jgi:REP element-mobilizing transposase RayT